MMKEREKEDVVGKMENHMMDFGETGKKMVQGSKLMKMDVSTEENGWIIWSMEKGFKYAQTEMLLLENGTMIDSMVLQKY